MTMLAGKQKKPARADSDQIVQDREAFLSAHDQRSEQLRQGQGGEVHDQIGIREQDEQDPYK